MILISLLIFRDVVLILLGIFRIELDDFLLYITTIGSDQKSGLFPSKMSRMSSLPIPGGFDLISTN